MKKTLLFIGWLLAGVAAAAQTSCTGGLGDPIVNITFGQGTAAGAGPPLAPGITNLTYQNADCPSDGYYTIITETLGCFQNTWWDVLQDHTGNPNGYFMLINASFQPNDFYVQTVSGLCGGTSYQFAAWVSNLVSKPGEILPNITFNIEKTDGTVLQSFTTGDIPESVGASWKQYAFYFTTPPGINSVILRMTNNAPGGNGNDIGLDDITFRPSGSSIQEAIVGFPSDTIQLCANLQPVLTVDATVESCYPSEDVQWQESVDTGASWTNISGAGTTVLTRPATAPGLYLYRLVAAQTGNLGISSCEVASQPVSVDVIPLPSPAVTASSPDTIACLGLPVVFKASPVDGGLSPDYQWLVNGLPASGDSAVFTFSGLHNGDKVGVVMTSDAVCVVNPVVESNIVSLPVVPIPVTGVGINASATQVCADSVVVFTAAPFNGGGSPDYQWQVNGVAAGGDSAIFSDGRLQNGDVVNVVMTGGLVCSQPVGALQPVTMTVYPLPVIGLDSLVVIAGGSSIRLSPVVSGDITEYLWTPAAGLDNTFVAEPVATPVSTSAYRLSVVTVDGCTASAVEVVEVYYDVRMPSAFTPNGDGHNDVFRVPPSYPVTLKRLAVYDRKGMLVFNTGNTGEGWDGNFNGHRQPAGVYVWWLEFNNPLTKHVESRKGTVVLVR
jgi:gliding motility-associated-like protein